MIFDSSEIRRRISELASLIQQNMNYVSKVNRVVVEHEDEIKTLRLTTKRLQDQLAHTPVNELSQHEDTLQMKERFKPIESSIQQLYVDFEELRKYTLHDLNEFAKVASAHEARLQENAESIGRLAAQPLPDKEEFDILEDKSFSTEFQQFIQEARKTITNPTPGNPFAKWLTSGQQSLLPRELDILAPVISMSTSESQYAYVSVLSDLTGRKKGEVSRDASRFLARSLLKARQLSSEEWRHSGPRPLIYEPTEGLLELLLGFDTSASAGGETHWAMQIDLFRQAISARPPQLYLTIRQMPGQSRPDSTRVSRIDSKTWRWSEAPAINIETNEEVRAHSSTTPGAEGQVFRNMITPFVHGCKYLVVACQPESVEKLTELKNAWPSWVSDRITIEVVHV